MYYTFRFFKNVALTLDLFGISHNGSGSLPAATFVAIAFPTVNIACGEELAAKKNVC